MAYVLVNESEYHRYRVDCSGVLKDACSSLRDKGIVASFTLVGSGARNMVTRNGNGPFDLDYNLPILKMPQEYDRDLRGLKETIRNALNRAEGLKCFSDAQDSTSCLTAILHFEDSPQVKFSFDVAIVKKNSLGNWTRLIHNKNAFFIGTDQYTWNEVPRSSDVKEKADVLKDENCWEEVRETYVNLKNRYLRGADKTHPSFVVYVEAVNQVYYRHHGNVLFDR